MNATQAIAIMAGAPGKRGEKAMNDEIYYTAEAGEFANNIQVGDVVVWQFVHGGRGVQTGGIGCVATISDDRQVAAIVDGALTPDVENWNEHDVKEIPIARLGKLNVERYAKIGLFGGK